MINLRPSDEQDTIINFEKNIIVISNPGTGKTTTLALRVIKLLESGVKPEEILCITFTDKAKKEMYDKIFELSEGKFSDSDIIKLNIHTFHSFAYNYLVDAGLVSGDIVGNNTMRYSILGSFESNKAFNYSKNYIISDIVPKTENAIRYIKSFGITPDKIDVKKAQSLLDRIYEDRISYSLDEMKAFLRYFVDAYKNYENSKQDAIDYSDMLLMFIDKFHGKKFQHVLVDEMQDMNELEARIVLMVGNNLFLVGDAKQAIFGFQGGSVKNFHMFKKMCEPKLLSLNRRSSQQILDYSKNYFLSKTKNKTLFERELEFFKSQGNGQKPKVISTSAYLSTILDVIEDNPEKTIGIITRTNRQIIEFSRYLDANNIKYSSTSSQATTAQAKDEIVGFIKGLVSDKIEDKIAATVTVFSPYSLKEAFEFASAFKNKKHEKLGKLSSWGISMKKADLDEIFDKVIFPICVSKGAEWFSTAISVKQQVDQYLALGNPTMEGMFDFIAIAEESYIERSNQSKITLTTVHKAKGRAFDVVVYVPSWPKRTSFIDVIVEAILASKEIDVKDELEEESLRIDFVAFTRAKEKLVIITDDKNFRNYHVEHYSELEIDERQDELVATRLNNKLAEAYSLFVSGRFEDSKKLLKEDDGWLEDYITHYFENIDHFSYSSIKTDPYEFLVENILSIPAYDSGTSFGSEVHAALAAVNEGRSAPEDYEGDVRKALENALKATDQLKKDYPGLKLVAAEQGLRLPLRSLVEYDKPGLMFTGFIDAVFQHRTGYLIVDYKTDKNTTYAADHKRQLAVYKKMYSKLEKIPENQINTCVIFVALRGNINTGRFDWHIEAEKRDAFPTFLKHLQIILEWKKDPKKFIDDLLENHVDDPLYEAIKEKLQSN